MKVVFIEDVPRVAHAGEIKEVADGYGRNYLLPRKLAILANSQAMAVVQVQLKKRERLQAQTDAEMAELAGKLNGMAVTLKAKAGAKGRLYGSITSADIADELNRSAGLIVDKRKIELVEPIHELGRYDVTVRFTHDITAVLKLAVASEEGVVPEKTEEKAEVKAEEKVEEKAEVKVEAIEEKKEEVKPEKKGRKKAEAKAEAKTEEKAEKKAEKKEKKVKAEKKAEKEAEAKVEEKAEKKEKKVKSKKKTEEKDAKSGE